MSRPSRPPPPPWLRPGSHPPTCVGDAVNLAARLEAHTKVVGHAILADAATRLAVGERCRAEALGAVTFKGKAEPVECYAIACGQKL